MLDFVELSFLVYNIPICECIKMSLPNLPLRGLNEGLEMWLKR